MPEHFSQLTQSATPDQIAKSIVCGPDVDKHLQQINQYAEAGYTHIYLHQVGPDQQSFFDFYQNDILPHFQ